MKYLLMIVGILIICVPDDASFLQFALQGAIGLAMFITGVVLALDEKN
jgi:membrane-bound ClpP family serine protease